MELVIEGVHKLILKTFSNRKISNIEVKHRGRGFGDDNSYVFTFGKIPLTSQSNANGMGKSWESEFEVWLAKFPNQWGKYEMFVMGLHGVTCYELVLDEVKSLDRFSKVMDIVVNRTYEYWKTI